MAAADKRARAPAMMSSTMSLSCTMATGFSSADALAARLRLLLLIGGGISDDCFPSTLSASTTHDDGLSSLLNSRTMFLPHVTVLRPDEAFFFPLRQQVLGVTPRGGAARKEVQGPEALQVGALVFFRQDLRPSRRPALMGAAFVGASASSVVGLTTVLAGSLYFKDAALCDEVQLPPPTHGVLELLARDLMEAALPEPRRDTARMEAPVPELRLGMALVTAAKLLPESHMPDERRDMLMAASFLGIC